MELRWASGMPDCELCWQFITEDLLAACATVGLERGKTTAQVLKAVVEREHQEGHPSRRPEHALAS